MNPIPAITPELVAELELLAGYNLANIGEGLKVHHNAQPAMREAAERLHAKGLLTKSDGGYLTDGGIEAAEHVQTALAILAGT